MSETNVITQSKKFHHLNEFQRGQTYLDELLQR